MKKRIIDFIFGIVCQTCSKRRHVINRKVRYHHLYSYDTEFHCNLCVLKWDKLKKNRNEK